MLKFRLAGFDQIVRLCGSSNFFFLLKVKNKPKGSSLETVFEWSVKNFSCFQMLIETTDLPLLFLAVQTAIDTTENNMFSIAFKNGCYSLPFLSTEVSYKKFCIIQLLFSYNEKCELNVAWRQLIIINIFNILFNRKQFWQML